MCFHLWGSGADDGRCCQAAATQTDWWGEEVVCLLMCDDVQAESLLMLNMQIPPLVNVGHVLWNKKLAEEEEEESPACRRRDQWQVFSAVFVLRVTLSLRQRKRLWLCWAWLLTAECDGAVRTMRCFHWAWFYSQKSKSSQSCCWYMSPTRTYSTASASIQGFRRERHPACCCCRTLQLFVWTRIEVLSITADWLFSLLINLLIIIRKIQKGDVFSPESHQTKDQTILSITYQISFDFYLR